MGNRVSRCDDAAPPTPPSSEPTTPDSAVPELARAAEQQLREAKGLQNPGQFDEVN